jgi:hypothetical protein
MLPGRRAVIDIQAWDGHLITGALDSGWSGERTTGSYTRSPLRELFGLMGPS